MAAKCITQVQEAGTLQAEADLTSFDVDGFTLNWSPNTSFAIEHLYLAIGDKDAGFTGFGIPIK